MYGVGLLKLVCWVIVIIVIVVMLYVYFGCGWGNLNEVICIFVIDYVLVVIFGGLILFGKWVVGCFGLCCV